MKNSKIRKAVIPAAGSRLALLFAFLVRQLADSYTAQRAAGRRAS